MDRSDAFRVLLARRRHSGLLIGIMRALASYFEPGGKAEQVRFRLARLLGESGDPRLQSLRINASIRA